ncbi:MAG: S41 family peptidase [Kofleriaceae bacterium]
MVAGLGCGSDPDPTENPDPNPMPKAEPTNWCERIVAGPAGSDPDMMAFASAHFTYRYFGVAEREQIDAPLLAAVAGDQLDLDAYAAAAIDVCALTAVDRTLGPASVTLRGDVAWVKPGTGELSIPAGAQAIALDLRDLPNVAELTPALATAVSAVLATPVTGLSTTVTGYMGHPDSWLHKLTGRPANSDVYQTLLLPEDGPAWEGDATTARSLAVVTDVAMPPAAARLALELRSANRAILVGHSVMARVAEAEWRSIGTHGLAIRTIGLDRDGDPIPDQIPADLRTDDPELALAVATAVVQPAGGITGTVDRLPVRTLDLYNSVPSDQLATRDLVGALVVAYGTARAFFQIYDPWPANIDAAYTAALVEARKPFTKRYEARAVLERFAASLDDAHVFVHDISFDSTSLDLAGVIPVRFDMIDGAPVVAFSAIAALHVGDTVVAVDGAPVASFLAAAGERVSAATPLNRAVQQAARLAMFGAAQRSFTLRAPNGTMRTEQVTATGFNYPPSGPMHPSGWLADVGAPSIYYLNLNGTLGGASEAELMAKLDQARTGDGLVIDLRGYPNVDVSKLVSAIAATPIVSPWFDTPAWKAPAWFMMASSHYTQPVIATAFAPPVAVIVGPWTQSFAENTVMMMMARPDLRVVGRQTSGSNGNVTSVLLPGGFGMAFTGMRIRYADGSSFHGVGIPVTDPSAPSVDDLAGELDRELLDAIEVVAP